LAFYSNRQGPYAIWSIRPDGSRLEPLSPPSNERSLTRPIWAPDGQRIAATRSDDGAGVLLHLQRPLDARLQALDGLPSPFRPKAWSPDGKVLAATQDQGAESDKILLYSFGGAPDVAHRAQSQIWEGSIAWLDDRRVLFTTEQGAIAVLDARTGAVHELLPSPRRLGEFPAIGKALNRPVIAFVEMRTEGDLWMMRRQ
jgi:WD40 repeat protein